MINVWTPGTISSGEPHHWAFFRFSSDEGLGQFLEDLGQNERITASLDLDISYHEAILVFPKEQLQAIEACAALTKGRRISQGVMLTEIPKGRGKGQARRSYIKGDKSHEVVVSLNVDPADESSKEGSQSLAPLQSVNVSLAPGLLALPHLAAVLHGVRRGCFRGPKGGFPVAHANFSILSVEISGDAPSIGDLHAATIVATKRALSLAETVQQLSEGKENNGSSSHPPFPELDNSIAYSIASLLDVARYSLDPSEEGEFMMVKGFAAYLFSQIFGYKIEDSLSREPVAPSASLVPIMKNVVAHSLAERLQSAPEGAAREMVWELFGNWTEFWCNGAAHALCTTKFK